MPNLLEAESEFISLRHAARTLYDKALVENKSLARAAERSGSLNAALTPASPDETLDFLAMKIAEYISVFGRKGSSTLRSTIEKTDIDNALFRDGANLLKNILHPRAIYWNNLTVKRQDFDTHISKMLF